MGCAQAELVELLGFHLIENDSMVDALYTTMMLDGYISNKAHGLVWIGRGNGLPYVSTELGPPRPTVPSMHACTHT